MNQPTPGHFFNKETSEIYDERNRRLAPISENLHFLIRLVLRDFPPRARVLCVGVGTGAEILSLSKAFPGWTFVGVDPSSPMLEVCRENLKSAGVLERCELIHGYAQDLPTGSHFDIGLSILVGHFVEREERLGFYKAICDRLRADGYFINAEISFDLDSEESSLMVKNWEGVQLLMGATPDSLTTLPNQLREMLSVIPPREIEHLLRQSGIPLPVRFFQAFMICAWYGKKQVEGLDAE